MAFVRISGDVLAAQVAPIVSFLTFVDKLRGVFGGLGGLGGLGHFGHVWRCFVWRCFVWSVFFLWFFVWVFATSTKLTNHNHPIRGQVTQKTSRCECQYK